MPQGCCQVSALLRSQERGTVSSPRTRGWGWKPDPPSAAPAKANWSQIPPRYRFQRVESYCRAGLCSHFFSFYSLFSLFLLPTREGSSSWPARPAPVECCSAPPDGGEAEAATSLGPELGAGGEALGSPRAVGPTPLRCFPLPALDTRFPSSMLSLGLAGAGGHLAPSPVLRHGELFPGRVSVHPAAS